MPKKRRKKSSSRFGAYYVIPVDRVLTPIYEHRNSHPTRGEAEKALSAWAKESARECRRKYKRCSQIGTAKKGMIEIRIGGRQGYHLWERMAIRRR